MLLDDYVKDGTLDYQKLYNAMRDIDGFGAQKKREEFFKGIKDAFDEKCSQGTYEHQRDSVDRVQAARFTSLAYTKEGLIKKLSVLSNREFVLTNDFFDAEDKDYLCLIGSKDTENEQKPVRHTILQSGDILARKLGKEMLYILSVATAIYIFNISKMLQDGHIFEWEWLEMNDSSVSFVGHLNLKDASVHYNY
jgi:hypothetical protein